MWGSSLPWPIAGGHGTESGEPGRWIGPEAAHVTLHGSLWRPGAHGRDVIDHPLREADESGKKCTDFDTITLGKYYVNNNVWNREKATGTQCVWDNSRSGSTISWGTNYSLANSATGRDYDVKSYASSVLGWHWGWKVDKSATGVPIRVGDRKPVKTSWEFTVSSNPGVMNVAYDLWLHGKNTADWQDQPTDEIMIWLNRQGGAGPLGSKYGSTKATLDLDDFTQALVRRKLLSNEKYVSGIESGTAVFKGTGRLDTKAYSVNIG
ncbi:GH12 family glycosyl hydrolase domain-containing protein [Streptomyces sp. NPDC054837]